MQHQTNLAINAAAWFFVRDSKADGVQDQLEINIPFRIGRNPDNDLCLECGSVSGSHAQIVDFDGQLSIVDLNSTNGTFLNGKRIAGKQPLQANDTIQFGTAVFQITSTATPPVQSAPVNLASSPSSSNQEKFETLFSNGVVPFYQPVVHLDSDSQNIMGYEVLGRSRIFGLRTPALMFEAASRLEMEAELSRVLRKKGIEVADELLPSELTLFVNTHPAELQCDGLEDSLFEIRDEYPDRPIMLEVHESVLNDTKRFARLRSTLENIDIQLAFHDFGASQIRLAELCEFVPDLVKFDVKLIRGIHTASKSRLKFMESLIQMLNDLGITPLAECVEQEGERAILSGLGFQFGQGFLFGKPRSLTEQDLGLHEPKIAGAKPLDTSEPQTAHVSAKQHKNAQWLLAQPAQAYTIQVLSAISEERALDHIAQQENPEDFAVFCKQGKTRKLYIVVNGVYADRSEAKEAAKKLASAVVSPWIRMLSSVHAEIRVS